MRFTRRETLRLRCIQGSLFLLSLLGIYCWNRLTCNDNVVPDASLDVYHGTSRHLLSNLVNCTPRAIEHFPRDFFTSTQRKEGAVLFHAFIAFYMFLGFALLCDDYFVPSLEVICNVLNIQSDVAGATFMAAGSSAPELATAIIAVFIAKDDIGVGTVVGSAVYNVMFVISVCALCAGMVVQLNWWPLVRDCLFYTVSVVALALVIMDEQVFWYEAVVFIVLYLLYILLMYKNSELEQWIVPKFSCCAKRTIAASRVVTMDVEASAGKHSTSANGHAQMETSFSSSQGACDIDSDFDEIDNSDMSAPLVKQESNGHAPGILVDEPESVLEFPVVCWKRCLWIISLPLKLLLYITIPDCRQSRWKKMFVLTFFMSLGWLSVFSYIMVWMITIIGFTAGIADTIMGLTFIAFGVSLPDVISSLIVVREGLGDMAVSNAVGSNVFDILICLGIPWLIQTLIKFGDPVKVYSEGLVYATFTLLLTVLFLLVATHLNRWRLTKFYGIVLMVVYVLFTVLTSLYELNFFGYVHPPECVSNY